METKRTCRPSVLFFLLILPLLARAATVNPFDTNVVLDTTSSSPGLGVDFSTSQGLSGSGEFAHFEIQLWDTGTEINELAQVQNSSSPGAQSISGFSFQSPFTYPVQAFVSTFGPESGFVVGNGSSVTASDDGLTMSFVFGNPIAPGASSPVVQFSLGLDQYIDRAGLYNVLTSAGGSVSFFGPGYAAPSDATPEPTTSFLLLSALALLVIRINKNRRTV